jgi:hypothetical protein
MARGSHHNSPKLQLRSITRTVRPSTRGAADPPWATDAQLAAASRAYRHLRWEEEGALAEGMAAVNGVGKREAPALYRELAVAITENAAQQLGEELPIRIRSSVAHTVERLLEQGAEASRRFALEHLLDEAGAALRSFRHSS